MKTTLVAVKMLLALVGLAGCVGSGDYDPRAPLTARQAVGAACLSHEVADLPPGVLVGADPAALPGVWHVLDSYAYEHFHYRALIVLGHIGGGEDALRLEAWINDPTRFVGYLGPDRQDNLRNAFIALGIMWGRGVDEAGEVFGRMCMRGYWEGRDIRWHWGGSRTPLSGVEETLCWVLLGSAYGGGDALLEHSDLVTRANDAAKERLAWRLSPDYFVSRDEVRRTERPLIDRDLRLTLESTFTGTIDLPIPRTYEQSRVQGESHFNNAVVSEAWAVFLAYASAVRSGEAEQVKYRLVRPGSRYHPLRPEAADEGWAHYKQDLVGMVREFDHLFSEGDAVEPDVEASEVAFDHYVPFGVEIGEQRRHRQVIETGDVRVTLRLKLEWGLPGDPLPESEHSGYRFSREEEPIIYMLREDGVWYFSPYGN